MGCPISPVLTAAQSFPQECLPNRSSPTQQPTLSRRKKAPGTLAFQLDILPTRYPVQMPALARTLTGNYVQAMCGRVIQSSGPLRYAIVDGMNVRDSRVHNYPPRWNAAPGQELLVIRRNHKTGEVSLDPLRWGLIPYWCQDPAGGRKPINAKCETVRDLPTFRDAYRLRRCICWKPGSKSSRGPSVPDPYRGASNLAGRSKCVNQEAPKDVSRA